MLGGYDRHRPQCIVCDKYVDGTGDKMHQAQTQIVGENLKENAKYAKNWKVFARLNETFDAISGDVYYHTNCYLQLYNSAQVVKNKEEVPCESQPLLPFDPLVSAEIVSFIQMQNDVVKLSDIKKLYSQRLHKINSDWKDTVIHSTRFKEHILKRLGEGWNA